jgi:hypothetical protein
MSDKKEETIIKKQENDEETKRVEKFIEKQKIIEERRKLFGKCQIIDYKIDEHDNCWVQEPTQIFDRYRELKDLTDEQKAFHAVEFSKEIKKYNEQLKNFIDMKKIDEKNQAIFIRISYSSYVLVPICIELGFKHFYTPDDANFTEYWFPNGWKENEQNFSEHTAHAIIFNKEIQTVLIVFEKDRTDITLPNGNVCDGEFAMNTLARCTLQDLGIKISQVTKVGDAEILPDNKDDTNSVHSYFLVTKVEEVKIKFNRDKIKWAGMVDLKTLVSVNEVKCGNETRKLSWTTHNVLCHILYHPQRRVTFNTVNRPSTETRQKINLELY